MAVSALVAMNERAFSTLQVRAKEKMCANDRILCHEDFCRFAKAYPEKMARSNILGRLRDSYSHHEPDVVFEEARREEVCPFEVQLELAQRADAIVADYNYVFEPGVAMRHLVGEELKDVILLVDEAHNLPDRAPIFSRRSSRRLARAPEPARPAARRPLRRPRASVEEVIALLEAAAEELPEGDAIAETAPPADALHALRAEWEPKLLRYLAWKRDTKLALPDDPVMDAHFSLHRFAAVLNLWGPDFTCVVERRAAGIRLALICLDPARALAPVFREASSTILLSATLTPPESIERVLGLERDRTSALSLPPPFPAENRTEISPTSPTTARARNYGRIAKLVGEMSTRIPAATSSSSRLPVPGQVAGYYLHARAAPRPAGGPLRLREAESSRPSPPRPGGILPLRGNVRGGRGLSRRAPVGRVRRLPRAAPGLPSSRSSCGVLRRAGRRGSTPTPAGHDARRAGGRPVDPQRDGRGVIALICRRFLEEPTRYLPRDWYEHPERARDQPPRREIRSSSKLRFDRAEMTILQGQQTSVDGGCVCEDRRGGCCSSGADNRRFSGDGRFRAGSAVETTEECCALDAGGTGVTVRSKLLGVYSDRSGTGGGTP
jgi:hypothetical protein